MVAKFPSMLPCYKPFYVMLVLVLVPDLELLTKILTILTNKPKKLQDIMN